MIAAVIFISLVIVAAFGIGLIAYNIGKMIEAAK